MPHRDTSHQEAANAWARILRDFAIIGCAVFLFVYGAFTVKDPTLLTVFFGAAMALFGIPPFLRREQWGQDGEDGDAGEGRRGKRP